MDTPRPERPRCTRCNRFLSHRDEELGVQLCSSPCLGAELVTRKTFREHLEERAHDRR